MNARSAKPLAPNLSGSGLESRMAHDQIARGTAARRGANIAFDLDVGTYSMHVHLESETCVCSFSSELLYRSVFSMYVLFSCFCSSRSALSYSPFVGLGPESLLAAILLGIGLVVWLGLRG